MDLGKLLNEGLGLGVGIVHGEGGQHHGALEHGGVGDLGLQAVKAVAAEDGHAVELALGLGQEDGSLSGVDGDEHEVAAGVADGVDLGGEVGLGAIGEGLLGDDLQAAGGSLLGERLIQARGVVDVGLIEHGDLLAEVVVGDVVGGSGALRGVIEADAEGLVVAVDALLRGGGAGDDQQIVVLGGGDDGLCLAGEDAAEGDVHTVVHQLTEGGDSGVGIALGVLGLQDELAAVDAAGLVDLVHGDLRAVAGGGAVVGVVAGHGANQAQLDGGAVVGALTAAAAAAAADQHGHGHGNGHEQAKDFFHVFHVCLPRFPLNFSIILMLFSVS